MTEDELENWQSVQYRMDGEGFDYCFDTAYNVERSLLNNLLRRDSTAY